MNTIKIGLLLVFINLLFGIGLGISFGIAEEQYKSYINEGVAMNQSVHDGQSVSKIWRYAQRAHFHSTGIAAFSIGLLILILFSTLSNLLKKWTGILIGLGGLYPLAWFTMFLLAPSIGRHAAHEHVLTQMFTYVGTVSLLAGIFVLAGNLIFGVLENKEQTA